MYKRIMLKISGEALSGEGQMGYSPDDVNYISRELKMLKDAGFEIVVVLGAGNFVRGKHLKELNIHQSMADYMGMLGTVMNAIALTETLRNLRIPATALTMIDMPRILQSYRRDLALEKLKTDIIFCAGGTGRPLFTTDTNSVQLAVELDCDIYLKATKVDGLYSADPKKFKDTQFIKKASFDEALKNGYKVMDAAAFALCSEYNLPVRIFDMRKSGNMLKAAKGENIGSIINTEGNK